MVFKIGDTEHLITNPAKYVLKFLVEIKQDISTDKLYEMFNDIFNDIKSKIFTEKLEKQGETASGYLFAFKQAFDYYQTNKTIESFAYLVQTRLDYQNKIVRELNAVNNFVVNHEFIHIQSVFYFDGHESNNITEQLLNDIVTPKIRFMLTKEQIESMARKDPEMLQAMGL